MGAGGHTHGGHAHPSNEGRTLAAALLTGSFVVVEGLGGWLSGSLALLADAGHMFSDSVSLFFAWFAFRLSRRPPTPEHSFGLDRAQVLVAFANGLGMLFVVGSIFWHAVHRILTPVSIQGPVMLGVAVAGLLVNLVALAILAGGDRHNLNVRGAILHVIGDLLASLAAIIAGLVVVFTGETIADPVLSLLVCLLLLRVSLGLVRDAARILLQASPSDLDAGELRRALLEQPEVLEIADLHVWCLTQEQPVVTLQVEIPPHAQPEAVADELRAFLHRRFGIAHATLELRRRGAPVPG
ncbi:MAG: cation diffusion facilitator family transporter [Myxococcota bacterium]